MINWRPVLHCYCLSEVLAVELLLTRSVDESEPEGSCRLC